MEGSQGPKRGEVVRVRLDPAEGSEQASERPALVLSPDFINLHSPVVILAGITTKKTERVYPFEALVAPPEGGLKQRSKVMLMQIRSVDKRRLLGSLGTVSPMTMRAVDDALKIATGLTAV